jgi:hypothetical protein
VKELKKKKTSKNKMVKTKQVVLALALIGEL